MQGIHQVILYLSLSTTACLGKSRSQMAVLTMLCISIHSKALDNSMRQDSTLRHVENFFNSSRENVRSLPSSMSSCGIRRILSRKSEFCRIPWNFNGKQLAGASAILVSNSMEILTFFQGIPIEMVRIPEPLGMIPMGIHGIPLEFH